MMNCEGYGRKWLWPFLSMYKHLPEGIDENHEKSVRIS